MAFKRQNVIFHFLFVRCLHLRYFLCTFVCLKTFIMIISIILFVIALILPDYYIWSVFIGQDASWWWSALYFVPTLMVAFSFIAVNRGFYHNTFMRIFFALSLLVVLQNSFFAVLSFAIGYLAALIVALALVLTLLYGFFFGWRRIKVKNATCASPLLPKEFEGYRILQMSDLHIGTFRENPSLSRSW